MKTNFPKCLELVLRNEGGWSDHPADPGGATMKGVTLATFKAYCSKKGRAVPSKAKLKAISTADVNEIYRMQYWDSVHGDDLPAGLDFAAFDYAVNSGPGQAAKELQRTVGATADGKIGTNTLAAIRIAGKRSPSKLIDDYLDRRLAFLKRLSTWGTFGRGWNARISSVRANAHAMEQKQPVEEEGEAVAFVESAKADPGDTAIVSTNRGKSAIVTVAGAVGTAAVASGDRILDATASAGTSTLMLIGIIAFVILAVGGGAATAYFVKRQAREEGTV